MEFNNPCLDFIGLLTKKTYLSTCRINHGTHVKVTFGQQQRYCYIQKSLQVRNRSRADKEEKDKLKENFYKLYFAYSTKPTFTKFLSK